MKVVLKVGSEGAQVRERRRMCSLRLAWPFPLTQLPTVLLVWARKGAGGAHGERMGKQTLSGAVRSHRRNAKLSLDDGCLMSSVQNKSAYGATRSSFGSLFIWLNGLEQAIDATGRMSPTDFEDAYTLYHARFASMAFVCSEDLYTCLCR